MHNTRDLQGKMQKIVPVIMIGVYPLYGLLIYFLSTQEGNKLGIIETDPHYLVFGGIFLLTALLFFFWKKFQNVLSPFNTYRDEEHKKLSFFMIDLAIVSTVAIFGFIYTFLFGWYPENFLFFVIPFVIHLKMLQDHTL